MKVLHTPRLERPSFRGLMRAKGKAVGSRGDLSGEKA